jgi:hypothetical protein
MRDIKKLIRDMLDMIPDCESFLRSQMVAALESAEFRAPECVFMDWENLSRILSSLGPPKSLKKKWQQDLFTKYTGKAYAW